MFFVITGLTTFMILDSDKYSVGGAKDIIKNDGFLFFHHTVISIMYYILGNGYSLPKMGNHKIPFMNIALLLNIFDIKGFSPKYINIVPGV